MSKVEFQCPQCQKSVLGECEDGMILKCPECLLECNLKDHPLRNKMIEHIYKCLWIVVAIPLGLYIDFKSMEDYCGSWLAFAFLFSSTLMSPFIGYLIARIIILKMNSKINENNFYIESKGWFGMGLIFITSWISVILLTILPLGILNIKQSNFQGLFGGLYYGDDDFRALSILCLACPILAMLTVFLSRQSSHLVYRWLILRNSITVILITCCFWFIVDPDTLRQWSSSSFYKTRNQMKEIGVYMNAYYSDGTSENMFSHSELVDLKNISSHPEKMEFLEDLIFLYPEGGKYAEINSSVKPILLMRHERFGMCTPVLYGDGHVECFYGHFKSVEDLLRAIKDRKERGIW